jgi:hypothetical protein
MATRPNRGSIGHNSAPASCPLLLGSPERALILDTLPGRISYAEER